MGAAAVGAPSLGAVGEDEGNHATEEGASTSTSTTTTTTTATAATASSNTIIISITTTASNAAQGKHAAVHARGAYGAAAAHLAEMRSTPLPARKVECICAAVRAVSTRDASADQLLPSLIYALLLSPVRAPSSLTPTPTLTLTPTLTPTPTPTLSRCARRMPSAHSCSSSSTRTRTCTARRATPSPPSRPPSRGARCSSPSRSTERTDRRRACCNPAKQMCITFGSLYVMVLPFESTNQMMMIFPIRLSRGES